MKIGRGEEGRGGGGRGELCTEEEKQKGGGVHRGRLLNGKWGEGSQQGRMG